MTGKKLFFYSLLLGWLYAIVASHFILNFFLQGTSDFEGFGVSMFFLFPGLILMPLDVWGNAHFFYLLIAYGLSIGGLLFSALFTFLIYKIIKKVKRMFYVLPIILFFVYLVVVLTNYQY